MYPRVGGRARLRGSPGRPRSREIRTPTNFSIRTKSASSFKYSLSRGDFAFSTYLLPPPLEARGAFSNSRPRCRKIRNSSSARPTPSFSSGPPDFCCDRAAELRTDNPYLDIGKTFSVEEFTIATMNSGSIEHTDTRARTVLTIRG